MSNEKSRHEVGETHTIVHRYALSTGEVTGFIILTAAGILAFLYPYLTVLLLSLFIILCVSVCFIPCSSFYLPVICKGKSSERAVSLTFDDGPNPATTPILLDLLSKYHVKATFFVTGKNADSYPDLIKQIIQRGHTIGNHTYSHDPIIMLRRLNALKNEILYAQHVFEKLGITCYAFRPPVGITNPLLQKVLTTLNMYTINFSCRAGDFGNRRLANMACKILKKIKPNDIVLMHDTLPANNRIPFWIDQVEEVIIGIKNKDLDILPLENLIERPVMKWNKDIDNSGCHVLEPVTGFYGEL